MIESVTYKGPLVADTGIPGERKCDGVIPAHPGCCRSSRERWLTTVATLDPRGWDSNHSIIYQIRDGEPQTFELTNRHVIVDLLEAGLPFAQP